MDILNINKKINKLNKYIAQHRLSDVFSKLNKLISEQKSLLILKEQVDKQADIYKNLLLYSFTGVNDPEREKIYSKLLIALYKIVGRAKHLLFLENRSFELNRIRKDNDIALLSGKNEIEQKFLNTEDEQVAGIIFNKLWLTHTLEQSDIDFIHELIHKEDVSWVNEALVVSALSVGLFMNFDPKKFRLLFDLYYKGTNKVWQRAIVGIIVASNKYADLLDEYPELKNEIYLLSKDKDFLQNLQYVIVQIVKTKDTEKISQKLQNEILPEVAKFRPKIEERLRLDDIVDTYGEDKNPDWETVFGDSPELIGKLEELSKMQIEGSDVFMATFAMLKHFPFFNEPVNWFVPFHKDNQYMRSEFVVNKEGFNMESFLEGLENSAFMCNSDKYSFIMNIKEMPEIQKDTIMEMFVAELESMNEIVKDDKLINQSALDKYQINQYVQDLYRFYKLYPYKKEFADIFETKPEVYKNKILLNQWFSTDLYNTIGALYFKNEHYTDAIKIYKILIDKGFNEQSAFEKIAYSYQKLQDFNNALLYYQKSELFGNNLKWTIKKIALCYRELNMNEKAIEYYKKAEENETENLYVQANLGQSYIRIKDYENALKHFFKVEYFSPSNKLIQRPIAWCSFALSKFDTAINYYTKLIEQNQADWQDYINYGHTLWCNGSDKEAVAAYKKSIELTTEDKQTVRTTFLDDKMLLIKHGIAEFEIELMIDYLYM